MILGQEALLDEQRLVVLVVVDAPEMPDERLRRYVEQPLYARVRKGQAELLADARWPFFRPAILLEPLDYAGVSVVPVASGEDVGGNQRDRRPRVNHARRAAVAVEFKDSDVGEAARFVPRANDEELTNQAVVEPWDFLCHEDVAALDERTAHRIPPVTSGVIDATDGCLPSRVMLGASRGAGGDFLPPGRAALG